MNIRRVFKKILIIILLIFLISGPFVLPRAYWLVRQDNLSQEEKWTGIITLWDFPRLDIESGTRYKWIRDKIRAFERNNPGVYIELNTLDWETGIDILREAALSGSGPDIGPVGSNFHFISHGYLEKLDQYVTSQELSEFRNLAIRSVKYDNSIWGIPWMMTSYNLYLNLDIFRERNVAPPTDGNWTYEEFLEAAKQLTFDRNGDGNIDVYGFNSFLKPGYYNLWGFLYSDGAMLTDATGDIFTFKDEKAVSAVEKIWDLKNKHGVVPEVFPVMDENKAWDMFWKTKEVAIYPAGSWAVNVLESLRETEQGFNFTVANYPIGDLGAPVSVMDNVAAYGVFKQEDKGKLKVCVDFIKFIASDREQIKLPSLGVFPVKKNIEAYTTNKEMIFIEQNLSYVQTLPRSEKLQTMEEALVEEIIKGIESRTSPEEIIDSIIKRLNIQK